MMGYPLVRQMIMSIQEFGLRQQFGQPPEWVGVSNYLVVLTDPQMWAVFGRSVAFCLICATATIVIGELLALLMLVVGRVVRLLLQVSLRWSGRRRSLWP